jgi:hypothetical protein
MRVAVIGDFGDDGPAELAVADFVKSQGPDLILTLGDNNYPSGAAATIDRNIGRYYHAFIHPYVGTYGPGAEENRFFPALGNHDWRTPGVQPHLDYFVLPGNERYYDVRRGKLHVFVVDSDAREPDGHTPSSLQAQWLESALASSDAPYKLVTMHHAPFSSSSSHGPELARQWPFREWGAHAVFAGHDHLYERLDVSGLPYFVNGLGGRSSIYGFEDEPIAGSRNRQRRRHGAQILDIDRRRLRARFFYHDGVLADQFLLFEDDAVAPPELFVPAGSSWKYHDLGGSPGAGWNLPGFDDGAWSEGDAQLGYGDGDEATVVSFGPDPGAKHVTTYFRRTFVARDPGSVTELRLDLLRDDGAVVHLNGTEVLRSNMPAGAIDDDTLASSTVSGNREDSRYEVLLDPAGLVGERNLLAVEIHQRSRGSSDIGFDLELSGLRNTRVLLPRGSDWRYLDDGATPPRAWRKPGFDDSAWLQGRAQLGYGDGDEATLIGFGPDPGQKHVTTYFRTTFEVVHASRWNGLVLRLLRDDGAVVYLNGFEVERFGLPLASTGQTLAGVTVGGEEEDLFFETRIDHGRLRDGTNTLAVELHQAARTSSDLSFDLELVGRP